MYLRAPRSRAGSGSSAASSRRDFAGLEPLLVAPLKSSAVFVADLSRALPSRTRSTSSSSPRTRRAGRCGRLLKDLEAPIAGRHVVLVEDVVDTGLTLHFLSRTLSLREPASLTQ